MKFLASVFTCTLLLAVFSFAGPFGLSKGMTLQQVKKACGGKEPVKLEEGLYEISPTKRHSAFETYFAWIDAKEGLHHLKAVGSELAVQDNGYELRAKFVSLESSLKKTYGECRRLDECSGSYWCDHEDRWVQTLVEKFRFLQSGWTREAGSQLSGELNSVYLSAHARNRFGMYGVLVLEYEFSNHAKVKNADDDVL